MKSIVTKAAFIAALAMSAFAVQAAGIAGGIVIGAGAQVWQGDVSGKATFEASGQAISASQIAGTGSSFQRTDSISGGGANFGGVVTPVGVQVIGNTTQFSQVNTVGNISGSAVGTQWVDGKETILNGGMGFASAEGLSKGKGNFQVQQIGAVVGIGGAAAISGF